MSSYAMKPQTKQALNQYVNNVARANGVDSVTTNFTVAPTPQQLIIETFQFSIDFLKKINVIPVTNAQGEKLGLEVGTSIASTNNSSQTNPRVPVTVGDTELLDEYLCTQTNYDVAYKYAIMDAWAHKPDFAPKLANMVVRAIGLDKIKIGWHGKTRVVKSDRSTYPMLDDVNKGWLQKIREMAPERWFEGTEDSSTHVFSLPVGPTRTYKNLDGLVQSAVETFIAEQWRDDPDLIAICGRNILTDKYLPLLNQTDDPINQIAARTLYLDRKLGTLPGVVFPYFPANTILITTLSNLSIYIQDGSMRRRIVDEPQFDRLSDYQSMNECFVVENYEKCCLIENIVIDD